jgi:hypothetical protein
MITPPLAPAALAISAAILLVAPRAAGQSADGFDTSALVPAPAPAAPAAPAPAVPAELLPSRMISEQDVAAFLRQISTSFSIRKRATDPFGRFQDPDYVPPRPRLINPSPTQRFQPEPPTAFADIIAAIEVNLVVPDKGRFLIGNRTFKIGDVLPLQLPSGKQVKVEVLAVTATRIDFRNVANNETASRKLAMLPTGMSRGTGNITAPGVQPADSEAPVPVQPVTPLSNNG